MTFADNFIVGTNPYGLFIDTNNSIYSMNRDNGKIFIWMNNSNDPTFTLSTPFSSNVFSMFVTTNGLIYLGDGKSIKQITKSNQIIEISSISDYILSVFIAINNIFYCSINGLHKVVKKSLDDISSTTTTVAGNGTQGSSSKLLNGPFGIFVDTNFDLYVADYWNNRIRLFRLGQINGTTVAGNTSPNITISLSYPTNVILDGNKYLFITDSNNHRIIGSDENGFRCIVACSMSSGATSDKLSAPQSLTFDSFGNLFVVDYSNNRIQKFCLSTNFCNRERKKQRFDIFI